MPNPWENPNNPNLPRRTYKPNGRRIAFPSSGPTQKGLRDRIRQFNAKKRAPKFMLSIADIQFSKQKVKALYGNLATFELMGTLATTEPTLDVDTTPDDYAPEHERKPTLKQLKKIIAKKKKTDAVERLKLKQQVQKNSAMAEEEAFNRAKLQEDLQDYSLQRQRNREDEAAADAPTPGPAIDPATAARQVDTGARGINALTRASNSINRWAG